MARIVGRGRYAGETYPEAARSSGTGGGGIPLSRTFYVGVNTNPTPDGSIGNPFPDPQAAVDAIPPPGASPDAIISWEIICAPGNYALAGPLTLPKDRIVAITAVGYGALFLALSPTVVLADATFTTIRDIVVPGPVATFSGIAFGSLVLDVTTANAQFTVGMSGSIAVNGVSKLGTNNVDLSLRLENNSEILGTVNLAGTADRAHLTLVDADVADVRGSIDSSDSFVGNFNPDEPGGEMRLNDTTFSHIARPVVPSTILRFASCEVFGAIVPGGPQGQYIMDSATLGAVLKNVGLATENGIALEVLDATASRADFTAFDGGAGDVTLGPAAGHTLENFILMAPAVAQNCNLPDAASWQIPVVPSAGGRSLYIRNRGAGVINVVPLGADTTEVAVVAAGTTLVLTPVGTAWTQVLVA